jgi:O-antigen ligase
MQGQHGRWLETHNAYTQMSSECGIPGLLLMLGGVVSAFRMINRTFKRAKAQGNKEVADACLCYMVSWLGYLVTLFFLAGAYFFTLPAMISLAIAMYYAAERELARTAPVTAGNSVDGGYGSIQTVRAAGNRFHPA